MTHIVYLHGFLSSSQSEKAQILKAEMARLNPSVAVAAPDIPLHPAQARDALVTYLDQFPEPNPCLVGSSLGGFYGLWLAEQFNLKLVLVNPALRPQVTLPQHYTTVENPYSGEVITLDAGVQEELAAMAVAPRLRNPKNYMLLTQTGDEVLDYQEAVSLLPESPHSIIPGGDHRFVQFEQQVPNICRFFNIPITQVS